MKNKREKLLECVFDPKSYYLKTKNHVYDLSL